MEGSSEVHGLIGKHFHEDEVRLEVLRDVLFHLAHDRVVHECLHLLAE